MAGKGYGLLFEQGCGKTLTAIAAAGRLFMDGKVKKVLVVSPLSVCPVWSKELDEYADYPYHTITYPDIKTSNKRDAVRKELSSQKLYDGCNFLITNYDSLRTKVFLDSVALWRPDMVIADESQRIKNPQAQQSKAMWAIGDLAKYRLILSGTPVCNTPLDYWSQYRFLDKTVFGPSYYAFKNKYAVTGGFENHEVIGIRHLGELSEKAHSIASRVRKEDALDLPPYITQTYYCDLEPQARAAYDLMERTGCLELDAETKITAPMVITRMLRLSQLTGGYYAMQEGNTPENISTAKAALCFELVKDLIADGHKVVIFCRFVPEIHMLRDIIHAHYFNGGAGRVDERNVVRVMYGETPASERGKIVEEFQTDPNVRVFIAQTHTAGLGITLHAADIAIFYSPDYSYADYAQARDRIHRVGQTKACTAIHLCCRNTIDEVAFSAVEHKRSLADNAVDNWKAIMKRR